jgi:hypothetical protein
MRFELLVLDGSGRRFGLPLEGEVLIGSAAECAIRLANHDVSRRHALLVVRRGAVSLLDLGSKNGTFVGGQRIKEARLSPGDLLRFSSVLAQLMPLGTLSDPAGEALKPGEARQATHALSPTEELPAVADGADIGWLLARWGRGGDSVAAALEWMMARAGAKGAALLTLDGGDAVVVAAAGDVGAILGSTTLASNLAGVDAHGHLPEAVPIQCDSQPALAIRCGEGHWLLLAVGEANPAAAEVELFARVTSVALRLDG